MSFVGKTQRTDGPEAAAMHPDFQHSWCQELIRDPKKTWAVHIPRGEGTVMNHMFEKTLAGPDGIRAHLSWNRPARAPDAITGFEECWLLSCGGEVDGRRGRAHGGFDAMALDQISGSVAHHSRPKPDVPATATLTINYFAPVLTPCTIFLRGWIVEKKDRKVWVKATMENGQGVVYCASKGLFVFPRPQPDQKL